MKLKNKMIVITAVMAAVPAACGSKKSSSAAASTVASVADLKLSSALSVKIPDKMATATGGTAASALALDDFSLTGTKSWEACKTMEETARILTQLDMISSMFCHFEAESANLKFGTKYNIDMGGGGGGGEAPPAGPKLAVDATKMQLWIDNSSADYLHVDMCQSGKLSQHVKVSTGSAPGLAKGSMTMGFGSASAGQTGGVNLDFDLTTPGTKLVKASMQFKMSGAMGTGSFSNFSDISLLDSGVSTIKMSKKGTHGSDTFGDRSMLLFNGTIGQVVFKNPDFSHVSTFGADGNTVADSTATADITVA
ncbi:MAG: hypothetical protein WCO71_06225, partial [Pseudomonadota bacterium]